jgi:hypothetical protein
VNLNVTLRELREAYPDLFYSQDWFEDEAFMDTALPPTAPRALPIAFSYTADGRAPSTAPWNLPLAVTLAQLYVLHPKWQPWSLYHWCADLDSHGQRIYVGDNGKGLEIHRHLHLTSRWGVDVWT